MLSVIGEKDQAMETDQLHRGRLIDHLHLIVEDLPKCLEFYQAVLSALNIPMGDIADDHFWADELFVSSKDSHAALGQLTGRHHLAFQADSTVSSSADRSTLANSPRCKFL